MTNTKCDDLAELIENWLNPDQDLTISYLSRFSTVSYPSIKRILDRDANPNESTCTNILPVVTTLENSIAFLKVHFPGMGNFMEELKKRFSALNVRDDILGILNDDIGFQLIGLTQLGITEAESARRFGTKGPKMLNKMANVGLVREINKKFISTDDTTFLSCESYMSCINMMIKLYSPERYGLPASFMGIHIGGWSEKGLVYLDQVGRDALRRISEARSNEEMLGDKVAYVGYVTNIIEED